jgi:prepilin signal peptidase PulO-like enzyme (type II secretory pathway)
MGVGKGGRKTALPFGPFMALGAFVVVFAGQSMVDALLVR